MTLDAVSFRATARGLAVCTRPVELDVHRAVASRQAVYLAASLRARASFLVDPQRPRRSRPISSMCGRQVARCSMAMPAAAYDVAFAQGRRSRQPSGITSRASIPGSIRRPSCLPRRPSRSCRMCMAAGSLDWLLTFPALCWWSCAASFGDRAGTPAGVCVIPVILANAVVGQNGFLKRCAAGRCALVPAGKAAHRWLFDRAARIQAPSRDSASHCPRCRRVLARHRGGCGDPWAYCAVIVGSFRPRCLDRILPEFADGIAVDA